LRNEQAVWIEPQDIQAADHVKSIVSTLFDEDERFVSMEETGDRLVDRFGVAVVRDAKIEAFPARAPDYLRAAILAAAKQAEAKPNVVFSIPKEDTVIRAAGARSIVFGSDDLILGGKEHEELLKRAIRRCRYDLITETNCRPRAAVVTKLVSAHSLPKTGIFAEKAGDFPQFPPQVRQSWRPETKPGARKAGISGSFSRLSRGLAERTNAWLATQW
jgi:hypothetical protein